MTDMTLDFIPVDYNDEKQRKKVWKYARREEIYGPKGCLARCIPFQSNIIRAELDTVNGSVFYKVYVYGRHVAMYDVGEDYRDIKNSREIVNVYSRSGDNSGGVMSQSMKDALKGVDRWLAKSMPGYNSKRNNVEAIHTHKTHETHEEA